MNQEEIARLLTNANIDDVLRVKTKSDNHYGFVSYEGRIISKYYTQNGNANLLKFEDNSEIFERCEYNSDDSLQSLIWTFRGRAGDKIVNEIRIIA